MFIFINTLNDQHILQRSDHYNSTKARKFLISSPSNSLALLVQLRTLVLTHMFAFDNDLFTFWKQLSSLRYLLSLKIEFRHNFERRGNCCAELNFLVYSIFNKDYCPLLKAFSITTGGTEQGGTTIPLLTATTKSTNIRYLSIDRLTFNDLIKLLPAVPMVRFVSINYSLDCEDQFNEQKHLNTTFPIPLMSKCVRLFIKTYDGMQMDHVEFLLKQTPHLKDLYLWGWWHLLDAKKWQLLLSTYCPSVIKT